MKMSFPFSVTLLFAMVLAFLVSGCTGPPWPNAEPTTVRIGYQVIPNGDPIVRSQGWLEQELEVDVEWIQFSSGADVNLAFANNQIDIGLVGSNPATVGIAGDLGYSVIWIFNLIGSNEALVVRADSGIRSGADLEGRRLATPFGSTAHYSLLSYLSEQGYQEGDVTLLDLQPQDALVAWQRADLDGAYLWNPVLSEMVADKGSVIVDSEAIAEMGYPTADLAVASRDFIARHPDIIRKWIDAQNRAIEFIRSNPDAAANIVAREFGISPEEASEQLSQVVLLRKDEQIPRFSKQLGDSNSLTSLLAETGEFLFTQGRIAEPITANDLDRSVISTFVGG